MATKKELMDEIDMLEIENADLVNEKESLQEQLKAALSKRKETPKSTVVEEDPKYNR